MINKYQQGGILQKIQAMPEQLKKAFLEQFAQWAQANGINVQQLSQDPQALEQAMTAFVQAMQGGQQAVTARLGAKLNYIRSLKGACPEGQEVKYFKQGGQMKCKCVDKAAGGEKVKDGKKEIADFKKKKACGGSKMKFQPGGKAPKQEKAKHEVKEKCGGKVKKHKFGGSLNGIPFISPVL